MRTFIAIELPQGIKDSLARTQNQLKAAGADVKWVEPANIHLTLKFLGEIDEKKLEKINSILEEAAQDKNSFSARIFSLGAFPGINSPRVIWVGIDQGDKEIREIAKALEDEIAKIGIPKEDRPFSSHITIGRTRSPKNREKLVQELNQLANNFGRENLEFAVEKIVLFKSTLTPKGPIYEALKDANLKTT
jgi:2'-5' RNA ligase